MGLEQKLCGPSFISLSIDIVTPFDINKVWRTKILSNQTGGRRYNEVCPPSKPAWPIIISLILFNWKILVITPKNLLTDKSHYSQFISQWSFSRHRIDTPLSSTAATAMFLMIY